MTKASELRASRKKTGKKRNRQRFGKCVNPYNPNPISPEDRIMRDSLLKKDNNLNNPMERYTSRGFNYREDFSSGKSSQSEYSPPIQSKPEPSDLRIEKKFEKQYNSLKVAVEVFVSGDIGKISVQQLYNSIDKTPRPPFSWDMDRVKAKVKRLASGKHIVKLEFISKMGYEFDGEYDDEIKAIRNSIYDNTGPTTKEEILERINKRMASSNWSKVSSSFREDYRNKFSQLEEALGDEQVIMGYMKHMKKFG